VKEAGDMDEHALAIFFALSVGVWAVVGGLIMYFAG
jgi:hypothetical protein